MKKIIYLLTATIIIVSCKKTDSVVNTIPQTQPQQTYILPTKIVIIDANGTNTSSFSYNGNKLTTIVGINSNVSYTYTGNLVTKITATNTGSLVALNIEDFVYNADSTLSSITTYNENNASGQIVKTKSILRLTYNPNAVIIQRNSTIDINSGAETPDNFSIANTFTNGNISKKSNINFISPNTTEQTIEYDLKNSPYKNVLGYNRLFKERSNTNNLIKQTIVNTIFFNGQTIVTSDVYTRSYLYNNDNFPTEIKYFSNTGALNGTIQFTY
jgi:hypothetical protein